jgi:hypothetical protein
MSSAATADSRKTSVPPPVEAPPPILNFAPLENGLAALTRGLTLPDGLPATFGLLGSGLPPNWGGLGQDRRRSPGGGNDR